MSIILFVSPHNNLLCKLNTDTTFSLSIFAPKTLVPLLLKMYHDDYGQLDTHVTQLF